MGADTILKDSGLPMAVIGYSVAEEAGMRRLASYLDLHSGYPCIHFTGAVIMIGLNE